MNTPQRDMGKHCWDYSLKIQCVSVTIPLGLSQSFLVANREQKAPQPPVPRSHQTHPAGCAWTHSSASSTALGKGSKACLASSLSTAEQ